MIKEVLITNHVGTSYSVVLDRPDLSNNVVINNIRGIGPGTASINTRDYAIIDGAFFNSSRVGARNITFDLSFIGVDVEAVRHISYSMFPLKKPVTMEFITDHRHSVISGYVESNDPDIFQQQETAHISVICPNPFFRLLGDDGDKSLLFSRTDPKFEFRFDNNNLRSKLIEMGTITKLPSRVFGYEGDVGTGAIFRFNIRTTSSGMTGLYFENRYTNERMTLDLSWLSRIVGGSNVANGDVIEVSTLPGNKYIKYIRGFTEHNFLAAMTKDSKWPQLEVGDNYIYYKPTGIGYDAIDVTVDYSPLYLGV